MKPLLAWLFHLPDGIHGVEGWSLRFLGMPGSLWAVLGLIALLAAMAWFVLRCYRREGTRSPRMRAALAGLRIAVLAILLILALQPALVVRQVTALPSTVVVLVDDTLSMRWQDRFGEGDERRALAAALGVQPGVFEGADCPTRQRVVRELLGRQDGPLARLAREHAVRVVGFGGADQYTAELAQAERAGDQAAAQERAQAALAAGLGKLGAGGYRTNLGRAVRETLDALEGQRLAALVLVSDGMETGDGRGRTAAARALAEDRGVPVFTVAVGDPRPPRNIQVAQLQGPGEVRKGSTIGFTALIAHRHYADAEIEVKLLRARAGTAGFEDTGVAAKAVLPREEGEEAGKLLEVALPAAADDIGAWTYKAVVAPRADEQLRDDNEAGTAVRVSDEQVSVLLVSADAGWEFQFLRSYLLRQSEHYKVSTWQQNADPRFNQDASTGMKLTGLPASKEELFRYDVVILYDPKHVADSLDQRLLGMLDEFVSRHHGGLCYVAGNRNSEETLAAGGPFAPLAELLPVVIGSDPGGFAARAQPVLAGFPLEPAPAADDHPVMQLAAGVEASRAAWKEMPQLYRVQKVARLKTLATALAYNGDPSRTTSDGGREPAIAVQYYGKGRVLYLGTDATWRWRAVEDGARHRKFWANCLDFLAAGRLEKKRILITTGGDVFDAGSEIRVRVEAYNREFAPLEGETFTVALVGADGQAVEQTLRRTRPGFFEGTLLAARTGSFEITAKADAGGQAPWSADDVSPRRIEVRLPQEELRRPEADHDALRRLSGDERRFVPIAEAERLAALIPAGRRVQVDEIPHGLWNTMFVLILLGCLLCTEWTLRKIASLM